MTERKEDGEIDGGNRTKEKEPRGQSIIVKPLIEMCPGTAKNHQEEGTREDETRTEER